MTLTLQSEAELLGQSLPPLLAQAEMLASTVMFGEHGRRRAGQGDEFWQYRSAAQGDNARQIDWRRSARSDQHFVREREWQAAQSVSLWVDTSKSMAFSGDKARQPKAHRAKLLALSIAVLLLRGGERVGLVGFASPPRPGRRQMIHLAEQMGAGSPEEDYGAPTSAGIMPHGRAVFLSDFLGDIGPLEAALSAAADKGVRGAILQVLDPAEEDFPFHGRTIFESMGGGLRHETQQADDLRDRYLARLAERKARLEEMGRAVGWHVSQHHTGQPAQSALLWLYRALEGGR